jgi:hypothetical protein
MAKGGGGGAANADDGDGAGEYYLCLPGRRAHATAGRRRASASPSTSRPPSRDAAILRRRGGHCTCRSFFQNIKGAIRGTGGGGATAAPAREGGAADGPATCKHLLAAALMPYVLPWSTMAGSGGAEIEIVDDREFARLVARASIG